MSYIRKHNKKWQAVVRRNKITVIKSFTLKSEATKWAIRTEAQIENGEYKKIKDYQKSSQIKFKELLKIYWDRDGYKSKDPRKLKYKIDTLARDSIGKIYVSDLTGEVLAKFRDRRLQTKSPATVKKDLLYISNIINKAKREYNIAIGINPVSLVEKPKEPEHRKRRLMTYEYQQLLKACAQSKCIWLKPLFIFAIETAMRRGELLSLTRDTINLQKRMAFLEETKNGSSRTVPLSVVALRTIQELPISFDRKLFPIGISSFRFYWKQAMSRANVEDFRFHDLRHEAISRFFEKGLSIPEVALISGHKDIRMLFRYTHLKAEDILRKL